MLAEIIKNTINTLGIFYGRGCVRREGGGGASYIIQRSTKETYKVIKLAHYRFRYVFGNIQQISFCVKVQTFVGNIF